MITPIYVALSSLLLVALTVNVILARRRFGTALGDGTDIEMIRCIRAQANFTEYTPLFLLLLGSVEYGGLSPIGLHAAAIVFLCGRLAHAYSLLYAEKYVGTQLTHKPVWRITGMMITLAVVTLLSITIMIQFVIG